MRVATWNVNGLRARLDFVMHWLAAREPDVVGLQEIKLTEDRFPHDELAKLGYRAAVLGQKGWNGVAILSRRPAQVTCRGLVGQEELGARLLSVEVDGLDFTTLYVPNGKSVSHPDFPLKLAWLDALVGHVTASGVSGRAGLLCGDFNICPAGIDSWDEDDSGDSIFHTPAERRRLQQILDAGYVDVFRDRHPDLRAYSWWDYRRGAFHQGQGLRIDLLLASQPALGRIRSVEIDREYRKKKHGLIASDHAPVLADLD